MTRTDSILLRLSPEERATLAAAAGARPLSTYIREAALSQAAKEPHMQTDIPWRMITGADGTRALTAHQDDGEWRVEDEAGGTWWASGEGNASINAALVPATRALDLCQGASRWGRWVS